MRPALSCVNSYLSTDKQKVTSRRGIGWDGKSVYEAVD
jgi:hypothetical protein